MVSVRHLAASDVDAAVTLHLVVLDMEFLSRFGPSFMRTYYRAWTTTPGSMSFVALDDTGAVIGVLLGATDPATHVRAMVREHGVALARAIVIAAATRPRLAKDLVVTRAGRYVRGVGRLLLARFRPTAGEPSADAPRIGEVTHVLVDPAAQGGGVGRTLIDAAIAFGREAGDDELVLVTPPDLAARHFYEALGWRSDGAMTSRSGEPFLRYRYSLR